MCECIYIMYVFLDVHKICMMYIHIHISVYLDANVCTFAHANLCMYVYLDVYTKLLAHIRIHMCLRVCVCVFVYIHVYLCRYAHIHTFKDTSLGCHFIHIFVRGVSCAYAMVKSLFIYSFT
jgi:hypothetical protein